MKGSFSSFMSKRLLKRFRMVRTNPTTRITFKMCSRRHSVPVVDGLLTLAVDVPEVTTASGLYLPLAGLWPCIIPLSRSRVEVHYSWAAALVTWE